MIVENSGSRIHAETEGGERIEEPSEDAIFEMMGSLDLSANTFITIESSDESRGWYVSIAKREEGGYEVEYRDARTHEHKLAVQESAGRIAREATIWISARPGSPQLRRIVD
jgi:hypothetical protein